MYQVVIDHLNDSLTLTAFTDALMDFLPLVSGICVGGFIYSMIRRSLEALSVGKATI